MSDPSHLLQVAQAAALEGDATLMTLLTAPGVYDNVPADAQYPYVVVGDSQVIGDDTDGCGDSSEIVTRTHVWSSAVGFPETKDISAEVRRILKSVPALAGFTVSVVQFVQTQFLRDPDGQTLHAVIEHRYLIDHAN